MEAFKLADIQEIHEGRIGSTVARQKVFSFEIWDQLQQQQKAFSSIAAWSTERFDLGQGGDPLALTLAAGGLTIIAAIASALPAVRATAVDPMQVLREE